jgi:predicted choloylglycine hydrolase
MNKHNAEQNPDKFVEVTGSHYDMGYQQGERFREDIQQVFRKILKFEGVRMIKPKLLPEFIFGYLIKKKVVKEWEKLIEIIVPKLSERMLGISEGSKTPLDELFVVQALEVLSDDVHLVTSAACSSFAVLPEKYDGHELVIGKNFDFMADFKDDNIVRVSNPIKKYRSIEVTYQPLAGSHDGMNEKGLVVIYNYGVTDERTQTRLPITLLVQQMLENCATVDEAMIVLESFRYPNAAILLIADAHDKVVSVEISPDHIGHRHPDKGYIVNSNMFLCPETKRYDLPHSMSYSSTAPKSLAGKRVHESNELRFSCAMNLFGNVEGRVNLEYLKKVLRDHGGSDTGNDNTICRHGEFFQTQATVLFFPKHRKMLAGFGYPCQTEYKEYRL